MKETISSDKEWTEQGSFHYSEKNYEKAIECYNEAIKINENYEYPWNGLGIVYKAQKDYEKAIQCYNEAIKINENYEYPWNGLGIVYKKQKDYEKAIQCYNEAIKINENYEYPWNGLGIVYKKQKDYEKAIQCYNEAIKINENYEYPWNGLGNVYKEQKDYEKAIQCYNKSIKINENYEYPWNGLGNVYKEQKDYEKAIQCYNEAIKINENYESPWYGLGIIYKEQKDYEKAIQCYNESIKINENYEYPWNGLGNVYKKQKDYEKAIQCYNEAIKINENNEYPWNGLGNVYKIQEDYEKAIIYYKKSFTINPKYKMPYNNLSNLCVKLDEDKKLTDYVEQLFEFNISDPEAYRVYGNFLIDLKLFNESKEYLNSIKSFFQKARELYEVDKNNSGISLAIISLEKLESLLNDLKDSGHTQSIDLNSPVHKVMSAIKENRIRDKSNITKRSFLPFINENPEYKDDMTTAEIEPQVYFEVLRRWNSYTPIIADNYEVSKGGGYFIKYKDKGIVIDPGFNFIDNFKNAGHFFKDIDMIFISHAHNDHMADLESILTLLYKYNDEIKESDDITNEDTIKKEISKRNNSDYNKVSPEDVEKEFFKSHRRKIIEFYMPLSVFKFYSGLFELTDKTNYRIHIIEEGTVCNISDKLTADSENSFVIRTIRAKHRDMISDICAIGLSIEFKDLVIIYTGDTGWDEEIGKQYLKLKAAHEGKYVILLAHIGGFKDCEDNYLTCDKYSDLFYKNHLGRLGLVELNEKLKPSICLISEFGEEFKGNRTELAAIFQKAFDETILFFPVDIGFRLDLNNKKIKCIHQAEENPYSLKYSYENPMEISTYEHKKNYSLHYYDKTLDLGVITAVVSELVRENKL